MVCWMRSTRDLVSTKLSANIWVSMAMVLRGTSALAWVDQSCKLVAVRAANCYYIAAR